MKALREAAIACLKKAMNGDKDIPAHVVSAATAIVLNTTEEK